MAREATVGPVIYARVKELAATGMKNSDAFRQVAAEQLDAGASDEDKLKKERSIATTFYRLQRIEAAGGEVEASPAPKKRGRPKGSTNKPKVVEVAAPAPSVAVVVTGQNGHEPDVFTALGQAKAAVEAAIKQAQADRDELRALRDFKEKTQAVLGTLG